jgi:uncharacterized protein (DUF924 family)
MHAHEKQEMIWSFWFGDDSLHFLKNQRLWFSKDPKFDSAIRAIFQPLLDQASTGAFDDWVHTKVGALALILLCDQFPRNAYRDDDRAFSFDHRALRATQVAIANGFDLQLSLVERYFLYLPLEHSEDLVTQDQSVRLFDELVRLAKPDEAGFIESARTYAVRHRDVIARFGRFPHRNEILGRSSTRDESQFLKQPDSSF